MIGVLAAEGIHAVVREFFELFKTPWEFYRPESNYDVLIDTTGGPLDLPAKLILRYGGNERPDDRDSQRPICSRSNGNTLSWNGQSIPIYRGCLTFNGPKSSLPYDHSTQQPVAWASQSRGRLILRVGFDLFEEVQYLLHTGQPAANAAIPTLDLHIALLRDWIVEQGIGLIEVPPVPEGHRFMVCLTHDVDHPAIRLHGFDHTTFGFLYRALVGSIARLLSGRLTLRNLWLNWMAALKLPFVHAGWASDFWDCFTRYQEIEQGLGATYFFIPQAHNPGNIVGGEPAPSARGSAYGIADVASRVQALRAAGCEIGLHGIDAWHDPKKGTLERDQVARVTHAPPAGVRMHWLFNDDQTPTTLESAGFSYDSTLGYNSTVGFRAGTSQVFKPLNAATLLELPLHVMDTALFFPAHLNLPPHEAQVQVGRLIDEVERRGGVFTINWHDRSLAPERLWAGFYLELIARLKSSQAWFPTAQTAVAWFRQRRNASFQSVLWEDRSVRVRLSHAPNAAMPRLLLRVYPPHPPGLHDQNPAGRLPNFVDTPVMDNLDTVVAW